MTDPRRNLVHHSTLVDTSRSVARSHGGVYRWKRSEQAVSNTTIERRRHTVVPKDTLASNFFNSANGQADFHLPNYVHYIKNHYWKLTLANGSADTDVVIGSLVQDLFRSIQLRQGDRDVGPEITPDDLWLDSIIYMSEDELINDEINTGLDPVTYQADATINTVPDGESKTYYIRFNSILSRCPFPVASLKGDVYFRVKPENIANLVASGTASDISVTRLELKVVDIRDDPLAIQHITSAHLDARYLRRKKQEWTIDLTSGVKTKKELTNFLGGDLVTDAFIYVKETAGTGAKRQTLEARVGTLHLENESGQNISDGQELSGTEMLQKVATDVYHSKVFQASNKAIYPIMIASEDPVRDWKRGTITGAKMLDKGTRVVINPNATVSGRTLYFVANVPSHVRLEDGLLNEY